MGHIGKDKIRNMKEKKLDKQLKILFAECQSVIPPLFPATGTKQKRSIKSKSMTTISTKLYN